METLASIPSAEVTTALQSIDIVVINPLLLSACFGAGVLSLVAEGLALAV
jgi:uncharacterized membrane protein